MKQSEFHITAKQTIFGDERRRRLKKAFDIILNFSLDENEPRRLAAEAEAQPLEGESNNDADK